MNSGVILSNMGFGIAVQGAQPSLVNANVTLFAPYTTYGRLLHASVAINGQTYSTNFAEMVFAQLGTMSNGTYGYLGSYQTVFGAISGCQKGYNVTITLTYNTLVGSKTIACPAISKTVQVNITMTSKT